MKMIYEKIEDIQEELESAQEYGEKYIKCKARGNTAHANKFKEMAYDELKHAQALYEMSTEDIEQLNKVYTLRAEEEREWEHCLKTYAERVALTRHILAM
jgi:hypothetical protein